MNIDLPKTDQEYLTLIKGVYHLIMDEMKYYSPPERKNDLSSMYPKFVVMYQFFRMLRGEAFTEIRPHTPEFQHDYYEMENNIRVKLEEIKAKVDPQDSLTKNRIKEMQEKFNF